jgi:site-specific recombinase XerD
VVKRALEKAGIVSPRKGAHQFRHTLASELLRHGGSLTEIGQILRHRSPEATAIYAKVDLPSLRLLAVPWPGGNQ